MSAHLYLKLFINLISSFHRPFSVQLQRFLSLLLLMVAMLQTNFVHIPFALCAILLLLFPFFCNFVDYIKSERVCQRARFYHIHCLAVQRAHVIFISFHSILSVMTTFIYT